MRLSKDVAACGDRRVLRDLIRTTYHAFVNPWRIGFFAAQDNLLRKSPAPLSGEYSKILLICVPVATGARDDTLFQRLHRFSVP